MPLLARCINELYYGGEIGYKDNNTTTPQPKRDKVFVTVVSVYWLLLIFNNLKRDIYLSANKVLSDLIKVETLPLDKINLKRWQQKIMSSLGALELLTFYYVNKYSDE